MSVYDRCVTSNACCTWIAPQHCIYKHQDTRTYMYRQTDRYSGWISEIVAAHTLAHVSYDYALAHPWDAVEMLHLHACVLISFLFFRWSNVCFTNVYERICFLSFHFYEHARQLSAHERAYMQSNSLFLLDTGSFCFSTTSCRPCHPAFLPGFHRLCECVCFSWVFTEYCAWVKVLNVCVSVCTYECI
jgi:hypothetical protein